MGLLSMLLRRGGKKAAAETEELAGLLRPPEERIGAGGLPIRPREPFRTSLRGQNEDLADAARWGRRGGLLSRARERRQT